MTKDHFLEEACGFLMRIPPALTGDRVADPVQVWGEVGGAARGGEREVIAVRTGVSKGEVTIVPPDQLQLCTEQGAARGGTVVASRVSSPLSSLSPHFGGALGVLQLG